jgi:hypothetical protein
LSNATAIVLTKDDRRLANEKMVRKSRSTDLEPTVGRRSMTERSGTLDVREAVATPGPDRA